MFIPNICISFSKQFITKVKIIGNKQPKLWAITQHLALKWMKNTMICFTEPQIVINNFIIIIWIYYDWTSSFDYWRFQAPLNCSSVLHVMDFSTASQSKRMLPSSGLETKKHSLMILLNKMNQAIYLTYLSCKSNNELKKYMESLGFITFCKGFY